MELNETDKRTRLIEAANRLIHRQGFNQTTLADIARESHVPLGNVYYYFKTKDELGHALIDHRANFYRGLIEKWDRLPDPKQRIHALIEMVHGERDTLAESGCPIGSLCQELHKDGGPLAEKSATLLAAILAWTEQQFRALGKGKESADLALHLVSVLQGASLLAHAFNDSSLVARETARAREWLDTL